MESTLVWPDLAAWTKIPSSTTTALTQARQPVPMVLMVPLQLGLLATLGISLAHIISFVPLTIMMVCVSRLVSGLLVTSMLQVLLNFDVWKLDVGMIPLTFLAA